MPRAPRAARPLRRLVSGVLTLLALSVLTFALLDLAPRAPGFASTAEARSSRAARTAALEAMRERAGFVDPATGEERSFAARYGRWLRSAVTLQLAPPGEAPAEFRSRIGRALGLSALLGGLALGLALGVGIPLGAWLGLRAGTRRDKTMSGLLLTLGALPDFLVATLAVVTLGAPGGTWLLPGGGGFEAPGETDSVTGSAALLARLAVPAVVLSLGPLAATTRLLRDAVRREAGAEYVVTMQAWGVPERQVRGRIVHNAATPLWTWLGTLVPFVLVGSVVVEQAFELPGFGRLSVQAAFARDVATVTTTTLISATLILLGLTLSDILQRFADPRVRLA